MSNIVKAVFVICVTALIMFVLYFQFFGEQKKCEKAKLAQYKAILITIDISDEDINRAKANFIIECLKIRNAN